MWGTDPGRGLMLGGNQPQEPTPPGRGRLRVPSAAPARTRPLWAPQMWPIVLCATLASTALKAAVTHYLARVRATPPLNPAKHLITEGCMCPACLISVCSHQYVAMGSSVQGLRLHLSAFLES